MGERWEKGRVKELYESQPVNTPRIFSFKKKWEIKVLKKKSIRQYMFSIFYYLSSSIWPCGSVFYESGRQFPLLRFIWLQLRRLTSSDDKQRVWITDGASPITHRDFRDREEFEDFQNELILSPVITQRRSSRVNGPFRNLENGRRGFCRLLFREQLLRTHFFLPLENFR